MRRDPTEFRERFKRWKAGEKVYDSGYATPTMKEESDYRAWKETMPVNLLSESDYNLRRAYQLGYKPELQDDGYYHLPTRDEKTGEILKGDFHPTLLEGLAIDNDLGYIPIRKNGKYYTKSWLEYKSVPAYEDGKSPDDLTNNRPQDEKEISWMYNWLNQRRDILQKNAEAVGWGYDKYYPKHTTGDVRDAGWSVERYVNPWNPFTYFNGSDPTTNRINKLIYAQIENAKNTPKTEVGSGTSSDYNLRGVYVEPDYWNGGGNYVAFAGTPDSDVKVHEFTHASHPKQLEYYIMNNIFNGVVPDVTYKKRSNLENAKEIYGALQQFRYKNNLKPKQKITKDWLLKNLNLFENSYLKNVSDDVKLRLFNDVAVNNKSAKTNVVYADYGKSPGEPEETYFGQLLPTVTIEGHKPTFWENVGNWFVDASKRAAFNENPAVMTASGWTAYPDGSTKLDAFNTPERNDLADKLVGIGEMGAWNILPEAILTPALEYGLKGAYKYYLTSPYYKKKVLSAINDAVGPWDKTKDAARAIIDDQLAALKKLKIHFVDNTDPGNSNVLGRHFFDTNDNYVSIKDVPLRERIHSVWHELSHGTEEANPLIKLLNDRIYLDDITKYPARGDFAEIRARANSSLIPKYLAHRIKNNKKIPFRKYISDWIDKTTNRSLDQKSLFDAYTESELYDIYGKAL